jgi:hypothetical protein
MKTKLIIAKANTAKAVMGSVASETSMYNMNSSYERSNIASGSGASGWREVSKESIGSTNTTHYAI